MGQADGFSECLERGIPAAFGFVLARAVEMESEGDRRRRAAPRLHQLHGRRLRHEGAGDPTAPAVRCDLAVPRPGLADPYQTAGSSPRVLAEETRYCGTGEMALAERVAGRDGR